MHVFRRVAVACVLAAAIVAVLAPGTALAHEGREVGEYHLTAGWGTEPAYAGFNNSVQLIVEHHDTDKPVTDMGSTMKVEVTTGSEKRTFTMEPHFRVGAFGTPGDYRAFLIPTAPGKYTFRFFGTIKGQKVDESFTSGPNTFAEMHDSADVQFPTKVPSGSELSQRIDREVPRLDTKLTATAKEASDDASSARLLGIVGIVLGALGFAMGGVALGRKR